MKNSKNADFPGFVQAVKSLCDVVESRSKLSQIELIQRLYSSIVVLLKVASEIPGYNDMTNFKIDLKKRHLEWKALYSSLQKKFGKYDRYREVFDPYDKRDKRPTIGSLADDIAGIYGDIKEGLDKWPAASPKVRRQLMSNWRFQFEIHWGEHGTSALRALYFLNFRIIEGKDGLPIGLHKKK